MTFYGPSVRTVRKTDQKPHQR